MKDKNFQFSQVRNNETKTFHCISDSSKREGACTLGILNYLSSFQMREGTMVRSFSNYSCIEKVSSLYNLYQTVTQKKY